jgi:hypothetical protein
MRQEKWDKLNKELDDALEEEFGTIQSVFENAKLALREHLLANKEQVAKDLQEMREKSSSGRDLTIEEAAANLADPGLCKTDNWIAGAKFQAERMYSEEDVIAFMQFIISNPDLSNTSSVSETTARYYLEQFKKK